MGLILEMIMPISYYYISDLHLFHEAAIRFDDRLFSDIDSFFRKSVIIRRFGTPLPGKAMSWYYAITRSLVGST